jgi:hypothetical protein
MRVGCAELPAFDLIVSETKVRYLALARLLALG